MDELEPQLFYEFGEFRLDAKRSVLHSRHTGQSLELTPKALATLLYLVEHAGQVIEKQVLFSVVWPNVVVEEGNLTQTIHVLRRVLGEHPDDHRFIVTVPGRGYRFVAEVTRRSQPPQTNGEAPPAAQPGRGPSRSAVFIALGTLVFAAGVVLFIYGWRGGWWSGARDRAPTIASSLEAGSLPTRSVAILPFESLSADPNDAYVAFGVAESVLHRLSSIRDLTLIARTSSFADRHKSTDAREIGRALNARYLVEGSVHRAGDRLRVTAQLIDATTGNHVWSLRFDRSIDDIFRVEDEIAHGVARALEVSLGEEMHPYAQYGTDAYLQFMQGRALVASRKVTDAERAIERFARAIEIAPTFAAAYAALADAYRHLAFLSDDACLSPANQAAQRKALPFLDRALELDPALGEAYVLRADFKNCSGDTAGAEADFRKGLTLSPNFGSGHERFAEFLEDWGRMDEALAEIDIARFVDPLTPRNHYLKGLFLQGQGSITAAEALYLEALQVAPDFHPALMRLAAIRAYYQGRFAEAVKLAEQAVAIDPRPPWMLLRPVNFYLELEDVEAARSFLAQQPESARAALWLPICLYERQPERAADILRANPGRWSDTMAEDVEVYVIRDAAFAAGRPARARAELPAIPKGSQGLYRMIALAQLSLALGDRSEGERLARSVLQREGARAPPRAMALALLGQHQAALDLLEEEFERGSRKRWWYVYEREPAFQPLRRDPRFQALAARARAHAAAQRKLLEQMRERGEVPRRSTSAGTGSTPC